MGQGVKDMGQGVKDGLEGLSGLSGLSAKVGGVLSSSAALGLGGRVLGGLGTTLRGGTSANK